MAHTPSPEEQVAVLARLLAHPIRVRIFDRLLDGPASASDVVAELHEPMSTIAYHFKLLADQDALEVDGTRRVRGALETTYRLTPAMKTDLADLRTWLGRSASRKAPTRRARRG